MVQRIALAVGAPRLAETYRRLLIEDSPPSVRLVDTAIALDQANGFPEAKIRAVRDALKKNGYAMWILRQLVVHHFYIFPVKLGTRQAVCELLEIKFKPLQATDPGRKIVSGPKPRQALPSSSRT